MAVTLPRALRRVEGPLVALALSALVISVFDVLVLGIVRGQFLSIGYVALCVGLTLAVALALGFALGLFTASVSLTLAVWAALWGWQLQDSRVVALGFAAATLLLLLLRPREARGPVASGVSVTIALCIALFVWPSAGDRLGVPVHWLFDKRTFVAVFAAVLAGGVVYARILRGRSWLPPESVVSLAGLVLIVAGIAAIAANRPPAGSLVGTSAAPGARAGGPPSVLVLVLDTVRADHLSAYGYGRDTTPEIQGFLDRHPRAVVYPLAFTPAPWTVPAHASLLTGLLPSEHGANSANMAGHAISSASIVAEETLAEVMRAAGFQTIGVFANGVITEIRHLERGFDVFFTPPTPYALRIIGEQVRRRWLPLAFARSIRPYAPAETINREVLAAWDRCESRPCFVIANYMDAHAPYLPRAPYEFQFDPAVRSPGVIEGPLATDGAPTLAALGARYDECIRELDAAIGALLKELESRGALDRSWVFITADHGEAFLEHGVASHGTGVYNEQVRIPLIVVPPQRASLVGSEGPVDLLDVAATVAAIGGRPRFGHGRDLRDTRLQSRAIGIESFGHPSGSFADRLGVGAREPKRAVVVDHLKLIERGEAIELYDLSADPEERANRAATDRFDLAALTDLLPPLTATAPPEGERKALTPGELETLKALGYVE